MKKKGFITLKEAKRRAILNNITYKPITLLKKVIGYGLIGGGISTLPLPTGSVFFIVLGCTLLDIDYKILLNTIKAYCGASQSFISILWFKIVIKYKVLKG